MNKLRFVGSFSAACAAVLALSLISVCFAQTEDYSQWSKSKKIVINTSSTGYNLTRDIAGYPFLVRLAPKTFNFTESNVHGDDIRFADSTGKHLSFQIDRWDSVAQRATLWVRMDTLRGNNATQFITMYWGKSGAAAASNGPAVFDTANGYGGVWHLSTDMSDATAHANNGIPSGGAIDTSTQAFKSWHFNGTSDYVGINPVWAVCPPAVSISMWMKADGLTGTLLYLGNKGESNFFMTSLGGLEYWQKFADSLWFGSNNSLGGLSTATWAYVTATWSEGNYMRVYVNGTQISSRDSIPNVPMFDAGTTFKCSMGANDAANTFYAGSLYEVRVRTVADSADVISLNYQTQKLGAEGPPTIKYPVRNDTAITGGSFNSLIPVTTDLVDSFTITPSTMPMYLFFDPKTGTIAGYPYDTCTNSVFYVRAINSLGYSEDTISITVLPDSSTAALNWKRRVSSIPQLLGVKSLRTSNVLFSLPFSNSVQGVHFQLADCRGVTVWSADLTGGMVHGGVQSIEIASHGRRMGGSGVYFLKMTTTNTSGVSKLAGKTTVTLLK